MVKNVRANVGEPGLIPESGRLPGRREWEHTPVFLPGKSHGQNSPWGRQEFDTTEQLSTHRDK